MLRDSNGGRVGSSSAMSFSQLPIIMEMLRMGMRNCNNLLFIF
jgi:hypothetical protein